MYAAPSEPFGGEACVVRGGVASATAVATVVAWRSCASSVIGGGGSGGGDVKPAGSKRGDDISLDEGCARCGCTEILSRT